MCYYLILCLCNLFIYLVICQFLNDAFGVDERKPRILRWSIGFIWYCGTIIISETFHIPILNFLINTALIFLITIGYKGKILKKIVITFMVSILSSACDIAAYFIMSSAIQKDYIFSVSYIFTVILFWVLERMISRFLVKDRFIPLKINESIVLFIIPLCSLVLLYCVTISGIGTEYLYLIGICVLIICFIIFYIYHFFLNHIDDRYKNKILSECLNGYINELELMKKSELKVEGMRHDLKNHLIELKSLAGNGDPKEVIKYVDSMFEDLPSGKKHSRTGSYELDSLINYLVEEEGKDLLDVNVKVTVPESIEINKYKLNIILGNLLQNAIEAAKASKNKYLSLNVRYDRNILIIEIENSYSNDIVFQKEDLISTKKDKDQHGIGLRNVKRIVKEQNGVIDIKTENERFIVKVMLFL